MIAQVPLIRFSHFLSGGEQVSEKEAWKQSPGRSHRLVTVNQSNNKNPRTAQSVNAKWPSFLLNRRDVSRNVAGSLREEIPREAADLG